MSSGVNLETMAADLIRALSDVGLRADRFTTGPEAAGINGAAAAIPASLQSSLEADDDA